jgi:hypothetical protein
MDLEKLRDALPIGLLMLLGSYVAAKRRQSGAARAAKEYPALAQKLGLSLRAAEPGRIGALTGEYDGYRVFVDPDDRARLVVYFRTAPRVVLRTYEHEKRAPAGMVAVMTPGRVPNRFFKDCYASAQIAATLSEREPALEALLRPFTERWPRNIAHVSITPERLECAVDFGRPSHISTEVIEVLLPASIALVRFIESGEKSPPD